MPVSETLKKQMAEEMFKMVEEAMGKKKLKPSDLFKAMKQLHKDDVVNTKDAKKALKILINDGRLVYTYFGGSFVELPHREGAAND